MDPFASFEAFKAAGMALDATWQPSNGDAQQSAVVLLDLPDESLLGDAAIAAQPAIEYSAHQLVGLDEGEILTIAGTSYRVRARPRRVDDGALMRALLGTF